MTDAPSSSWQARTGKTAGIDPDQFELLKAAVQETVFLMRDAASHILPRHQGNLHKEYAALRGETASMAGLFGAFHVMKPEMIGPTEIAWVRKVATFHHHMMNSIAGKEWDDTADITTHNLNGMDVAKMVVWSRLHRNAQDIERALSAQPARTEGVAAPMPS